MKKTLTISIAAYNVQNYIRQVLDSLIVEEIMDDLEVLVINDGSSDNTKEIVKKYEERYPHTFKLINKENGGWGSTVNKGMELATGKYFRLLDGDDWYYKENLVEYINFLKKVDADIVLSPFGMYDDTLGEVYAINEMPLEANKKYDFEEIANIATYHMHGLAANLELVRKANIHIVDHCFYTDIQFVVELCASAESLIYYSKPIYCYRVGRDGQSVSDSGYLKHIGDNKRVAEELIRYGKKIGLTPNKKDAFEKRVSYALTLEFYTYCLLSSSERKEKVRVLKQFIEDNGVNFVPLSMEVSLNLKTGFMFSSIIHTGLNGIRKMAKKMHIDLSW